MPAQLLKGKPVADAVKEELSAKIADLSFVPGLRFVRVGEDPASMSYVRGKQKMAESIGLDAQTHELPEETTQEALLALIEELNNDDNVDGILVQLPVPDHIDDTVVLEAINPEKDVDGFHPENVGRLWTGQESLLPCTPAGLIRIMDHYELPIQGQHVVIVGRSNIVGKPAAAVFLARSATVTIAHSRTRDLPALTRQADVIVAAVGIAGFIKADMVKEGVVALDVGLTRIDGKIVGDIHPDVAEKASHLTPMPGGTGRMTVAMLMENTYNAAVRRRG